MVKGLERMGFTNCLLCPIAGIADMRKGDRTRRSVERELDVYMSESGK